MRLDPLRVLAVTIVTLVLLGIIFQGTLRPWMVRTSGPSLHQTQAQILREHR